MHAPLYQLEQAFNRQGLKLSRQTMSNWLLNVWEMWLQPVYNVLHEKLCKEQVLHADEATLQVLKEAGRPSISKSHMWLYRTSGCAEQTIVLYEYQSTRKAEYAETFLKGFSGWLHAGGYQGTTGCRRISGWLGAGLMRGENLTRRCKRCLKKSKKILRQRSKNTAPGCLSWRRLLQN